MADQPTYHYGYRPIHQPKVVSSLPERERQRAQTRRQYLKTQKTYKVLLIGESGVGKSTLVARLCEDTFLAESRKYTLGRISLSLPYHVISLSAVSCDLSLSAVSCDLSLSLPCHVISLCRVM